MINLSKLFINLFSNHDFRSFGSIPQRSVKFPSLAVIKVGGEVLEEPHLNSLVQALKTIQERKQPCAVIHGGGPQLNDELKKRKVEPNYIRGHRVTDLAVLGVARELFTTLNARLVDRLNKSGVPAQAFPTGVFAARIARKESGLGYVGEVESVIQSSVEQCLEHFKVPVLASLGVNVAEIDISKSFDSSKLSLTQLLNINADVAAREFAGAFGARRVVFTSSKGGWIENGQIVPNIDLSREYERLKAEDYTGRQGTLLKLEEIKALLDNLPAKSTVTICAADKIIESLYPSLNENGKTPGSTFFYEQKKVYDEIRVGLIGARGYTGKEFCRLLNNHPNFKLVAASSRQNIDQNVLKTFELERSKVEGIQNDLKFTNIESSEIQNVSKELGVNLWVLALPNNLSQPFSKEIDKFNEVAERKVKMIDLSADNRFQPENVWTYGMPERKGQRLKLSESMRISNPGCYATGIQIALMPIMLPLEESIVKLKEKSIPTCFGVSGYSGAGTTPSRNNDEKFLQNNIVGYKLMHHIHEKECSRFLGTPINFIPHVGQFFQGIHLTINCFLQPKSDGTFPTRKELIEHYREYYMNEKLVKRNDADGEFNTVKSVQNQHHVEIGGFQIDEKTGRVVLISLIDNLLKGAATQAIQNANLAFGLDEYSGVPIVPQ